MRLPEVPVHKKRLDPPKQSALATHLRTDKPSSPVTLKPTLPKQWRHALVFGLAIVSGLVGFQYQAPTDNAIASDEAVPQQAEGVTYDRPVVQLPSIKSLVLPPVPVKKTEGKDPFMGSVYALLLDDKSKVALYEKEADERIAIASTTKIATAVVALRNYRLTDRVTISETAASQIGSGVGFRVGETATIEQLLYGLMIVSGNDAAVALAEQMAQPEDTDKTARFIDAMNKLAKELQMNDTYFKNPAGLDDSAYSSARDMAKLMSYGLKDKNFKSMISKADYQYTSPEGYLHTFKNSNRLVTTEMYYDGIIGGKTGFTPETPEGGAGHCLIVAAERNGHTLVAAVFRTYSQTPQASAEVARNLLNYGFDNFAWQDIVR